MENKIIDRVRKLLAKANDPSVTENEASLFAAKAQEILAEHGMSLCDVPEEERDDHVTEHRWEEKYGQNAWRRQVAAEAAELYFCRLSFVRGTDMFILTGRPHNIEVAKEMIQYLINTIVRLGKQYTRENGLNTRARIPFERGCGARVCYRLYELVEEQKKKNAPQGQGTGLPALYDSEAAAIDAFFGDNKPKSAKLRNDLSSPSATAGYAAGAKISLNPQVSGESARGRLLS